MGQLYSAYIHMKFCDDTGEKFCKSIRESINQYQSDGSARFNLEGLNLIKPLDCFLAVTSTACYGLIHDDDCFPVWYSDFDATYGWESVMCEIFGKAARFLGDGGYIDISVDLEPWHSFKKERGAVTVWHRNEN